MPVPRLLVAARQWQLAASSTRAYSTTAPPASSPSTPSSLLRQLMRRVAQPVAIITAHLPASSTASSTASTSHNHGATLSSVSSISLSPPLIAFSLRLPSRLASHLLAPDGPKLTVHLLASTGEALARTFARQPSAPAKATPSSSPSETRTTPSEGNGEGIPTFVPYPPHLFQELEANSLGSLECTILSHTSLASFDDANEKEVGGAVSELFIARVEGVRLSEGKSEEMGSLVHWEQRYMNVASE